ncbi:MAG: hypothetical protein P9M07_05105 [Candidatus Aceula meridiana]|nr:hypothetical protein [Candidatus Aceula meridiana]
MNQKILLLLVALWLCWVPKVTASLVCTFEGQADFSAKEVKIDFNFFKDGQLSFYAFEENTGDIRFSLDADRFKAMLFEITTRIEGSARIIEDPKDPDLFLKGSVTPSDVETFFAKSPLPSSGNFEVRGDRFYLKPLKLGNLKCVGYFGLVSPYDVDLNLGLRNVSLLDFFSWVGARDIFSAGEVSGEMRVSGFSDQIFLSGLLTSYDGEIENFTYDYIIAGFEGLYPTIDLRQTSVSERDGIGVRVIGELDLSQDFQKFHEQLARLKMEPIIQGNDVERQWTIRRQNDQGRERETGFHYRLRKPREATGVEETDMFGIHRSIKF